MIIPTKINYIRYFFVPFSEPQRYWADPLIIILSIVWSIIVTYAGIDSPFNVDDLNALNNVLSGTLGFLLPLYLTTCIDKSKKGIELYDALCGDVLALAWQVAAYGDQKNRKDEPDMCDDGDTWLDLKNDIFNALEIIPDAIKHVFRKDFKYHYLIISDNEKRWNTVKEDWDIYNTTINAIKTIDREMYENLDNRDKFVGKKDTPIEAIMFYLVFRLRKIQVERQRYISIMMEKWNDIYSSYGTTSSLINYNQPLLFSFVLYSATVLYVIILPFTFVDQGGKNVLLTGLIIYFFLSLNSAGKILQNPFNSLNHDMNVFKTVSKTAENTRYQIRKIKYYGQRKECSKIRFTKIKAKLRFRPFKD